MLDYTVTKIESPTPPSSSSSSSSSEFPEIKKLTFTKDKVLSEISHISSLYLINSFKSKPKITAFLILTIILIIYLFVRLFRK